MAQMERQHQQIAGRQESQSLCPGRVGTIVEIPGDGDSLEVWLFSQDVLDSLESIRYAGYFWWK